MPVLERSSFDLRYFSARYLIVNFYCHLLLLAFTAVIANKNQMKLSDLNFIARF